MLVSIIPSVCSDSAVRFSEATSMLNDLAVKKFPHSASFLNMNHVFCPFQVVDPQCFKSVRINRNGKQTNVHLSPIGAQKFARSILEHCTVVVKNRFEK